MRNRRWNGSDGDSGELSREVQRSKQAIGSRAKVDMRTQRSGWAMCGRSGQILIFVRGPRLFGRSGGQLGRQMKAAGPSGGGAR